MVKIMKAAYLCNRWDDQPVQSKRGCSKLILPIEFHLSILQIKNRVMECHAFPSNALKTYLGLLGGFILKHY